MGIAVAVEGSMSPTTEKDTPAFEQAVKRNNLELSDRGDEAQAEGDDEWEGYDEDTQWREMKTIFLNRQEMNTICPNNFLLSIMFTQAAVMESEF